MAHFYWSPKQHQQHLDLQEPDEAKCKIFASINGQAVQYSEMQSGINHGSNWDDSIYLGEGTFSHRELIHECCTHRGGTMVCVASERS